MFLYPEGESLNVNCGKVLSKLERLSIHESSPAKRGASIKFRNQCEKYLATQYFPSQPVGQNVNGYRNENLEKQTFTNESFDIVVAQDVMEHVYDPERAFSEIARTLNKGGAHIFTVPLVNKHKKTEVWAREGDNGEPVFLKNSEYHGNPIDPKGTPFTMHWGFDIVDFIKEKSSLETIIEYIDDLSYGVRAEYIEVLISLKKNV